MSVKTNFAPVSLTAKDVSDLWRGLSGIRDHLDRKAELTEALRTVGLTELAENIDSGNDGAALITVALMDILRGRDCFAAPLPIAAE